ncbi:MAG: lipid hydroperoxide peroxidase [Lentisphaerae bacterium RIFOXYB12_FULL_65_16]|nr:MAG: lipid hydroperoxide peroxidase [Lentisphaerae bacterium RIFOXYA12_64_32]OGV90490.1 MAG: lipid hydroperoxide peroxidase [Lentisphaerae bacterium RIFOXYB12_FULL_65_16]
MQERKGLVTFKGNPLTLVGKPVAAGMKAPKFLALDGGLNPVGLDASRGKVRVLVSVPSLDTPVCDVETRRFNVELGKLGDQVAGIILSMDLPFAQQRWCAAAGVKNVQTLSDYRDAKFGKAYGLIIKELRLLARAVIVVDQKGVVRYTELVPEIASEPDYEAALQAVKACL